ncbi:MAG: hypothetical protein JWR49_208 [Tardiphaga sp.]|nr:hypothetical protein [Tardiphaga sp.]
MTASRYAIWLLGAFASLALVMPAGAQTQIYSREQDIPEVRLGQRIMVDDGSCPAGQIKEVSGTTLTAAGVTRVRKCVPRLGTKKK